MLQVQPYAIRSEPISYVCNVSNEFADAISTRTGRDWNQSEVSEKGQKKEKILSNRDEVDGTDQPNIMLLLNFTLHGLCIHFHQPHTY